jgi:RNA polymerase sigma factor (sigma-70 family)
MRSDNKGGRDCTPPEDELLRLAQEEQSTEALHELMLRYFPELADLIAGLARRVGVQEADVEDIVQDFFAVFRKAVVERYDRNRLSSPNRCRLRTFLGKAAHDHAVDAIRKLLRHRQHEAEARCYAQAVAAGSEATAAPDWLDPSAAWEEDPVLVAEGEEALAALDAALARLTADDRLLWEAAWDDLPAAEIADRLGITASTVHRRRWRLLWRLWAEVGCRY